MKRVNSLLQFPALLSAVALAVGVAAAVNAEPATTQNPWDGWQALVYKTRAAFFIKGRVQMSFNDHAGVRLFETDVRAKFLGATLARERTQAVLDPETGLTRDYLNLTPKRGRHYVFGEDGYVVEKLNPTNGFDAPLDQWEVTSRAEFPYPENDDLGSNHVYVSYSMLSHLRDTGLDKLNDETTIYVATSKGPERYRIRIGAVRTVKRDFVDLDTGKKRIANARELRLDVSPVDPTKAKDFLGLKGRIEVWVEAETKTLLRISGKVPKVPGRVVVELTGIGRG